MASENYDESSPGKALPSLATGNGKTDESLGSPYHMLDAPPTPGIGDVDGWEDDGFEELMEREIAAGEFGSDDKEEEPSEEQPGTITTDEIGNLEGPTAEELDAELFGEPIVEEPTTEALAADLHPTFLPKNPALTPEIKPDSKTVADGFFKVPSNKPQKQTRTGSNASSQPPIFSKSASSKLGKVPTRSKFPKPTPKFNPMTIVAPVAKVTPASKLAGLAPAETTAAEREGAERTAEAEAAKKAIEDRRSSLNIQTVIKAQEDATAAGKVMHTTTKKPEHFHPDGKKLAVAMDAHKPFKTKPGQKCIATPMKKNEPAAEKGPEKKEKTRRELEKSKQRSDALKKGKKKREDAKIEREESKRTGALLHQKLMESLPKEHQAAEKVRLEKAQELAEALKAELAPKSKRKRPETESSAPSKKTKTSKMPVHKDLSSSHVDEREDDDDSPEMEVPKTKAKKAEKTAAEKKLKSHLDRAKNAKQMAEAEVNPRAQIYTSAEINDAKKRKRAESKSCAPSKKTKTSKLPVHKDLDSPHVDEQEDDDDTSGEMEMEGVSVQRKVLAHKKTKQLENVKLGLKLGANSLEKKKATAASTAGTLPSKKRRAEEPDAHPSKDIANKKRKVEDGSSKVVHTFYEHNEAWKIIRDGYKERKEPVPNYESFVPGQPSCYVLHAEKKDVFIPADKNKEKATSRAKSNAKADKTTETESEESDDEHDARAAREAVKEEEQMEVRERLHAPDRYRGTAHYTQDSTKALEAGAFLDKHHKEQRERQQDFRENQYSAKDRKEDINYSKKMNTSGMQETATSSQTNTQQSKHTHQHNHPRQRRRAAANVVEKDRETFATPMALREAKERETEQRAAQELRLRDEQLEKLDKIRGERSNPPFLDIEPSRNLEGLIPNRSVEQAVKIGYWERPIKLNSDRPGRDNRRVEVVAEVDWAKVEWFEPKDGERWLEPRVERGRESKKMRKERRRKEPTSKQRAEKDEEWKKKRTWMGLVERETGDEWVERTMEGKKRETGDNGWEVKGWVKKK